MGNWCPSCGAEYVEGWGACSQCGDTLVEQPPAQRKRKRRGGGFDPDDVIFIEPRAARNHEDPFVPIWEGPTTEGSVLARRLEKAHIPVDLGEADESGRTRVEVPRSYIVEAYDILDEVEQGLLPLPEPDEHDGFDTDFGSPDLPEPYVTTGWSTPVRILIAVAAAVVIVALIIAY